MPRTWATDRWATSAMLAAGLALCAGPAMAEMIAVQEGSTITTTREATLNGTTLPKGTELKVAAIKKDDAGAVTRVDLQQMEGDKKLFKAITPEAIVALTAAPNSAAPSGDRASIFRPAAQIPIISDLSLGGVVFPRGTVLQIDRVEKNRNGKVVKLDLRETSGRKRLMRGVAVEKLLMALSPDDVTWPDGAVGRVISLGAQLTLGGSSFTKGTKLVVTRVETEPKGGQVVKVDLRESEGEKRELSNVAIAILKENGALGSAAGAVK